MDKNENFPHNNLWLLRRAVHTFNPYFKPPHKHFAKLFEKTRAGYFEV